MPSLRVCCIVGVSSKPCLYVPSLRIPKGPLAWRERVGGGERGIRDADLDTYAHKLTDHIRNALAMLRNLKFEDSHCTTHHSNRICIVGNAMPYNIETLRNET